MKEQRGEVVRVVYVEKENAKPAKCLLKQQKLLNDNFRMISVRNEENGLIAIPVTGSFDQDVFEDENESMIVRVGELKCPYSTKRLGNCRTTNSVSENLTLAQSVILDVSSSSSPSSSSSEEEERLPQSLVERVLQLDATVCPGSKRRPFLERFGDDRTVVVPPGAFDGEEFLSILRAVRWYRRRKIQNDEDDTDDNNLYNAFWRRLAVAHKSPRVVRRGGIDPNSKIRESGHTILWPIATHRGTIFDTIGPQSPSWIKVTEQGVKQSFDLTKVMFSRGNISEKIRFGTKLVREGDVVLDLYAGIGYYTLPAVVHGKAATVFACEWNKNAVDALRFNIRDNKIDDKVRVFEGDCRESVRIHNIVDKVDRVSLGLLPSSEGGWRAAVRALGAPSGGWLHVHANVPASELESWTLWLCHSLEVLAEEENRPDDWFVICNHVERVKSFAPTVFHYVADVFVGDPSSGAFSSIDEDYEQRNQQLAQELLFHDPSKTATTTTATRHKSWMWRSSDRAWIPVLKDAVVRPSCALSPDGVLSQDWMR